MRENFRFVVLFAVSKNSSLLIALSLYNGFLDLLDLIGYDLVCDIIHIEDVSMSSCLFAEDFYRSCF